MDNLLQYLHSIQPISPGLDEHLRRILRHRLVRKKEFLLRSGHVCRSIYFIERGLLRCFYIKDDQQVCAWFMKESDVIVSVESFFYQKESKESIQALEDCDLYGIEHTQLEHIYRTFPEFNFIGRVLVQNYYTLSERRLYSLRMQRSQERYDYLLQHHADLLLRVPAKYIASYLGISEETLSRIRSKKFFS